MISPLDDARAAVLQSEHDAFSEGETALLRDAIRALIQHGEEMERRAEKAETRLARMEEPDRPPSGLQPTMGEGTSGGGFA